MSFIIVYITYPNKEEAMKISKHLVDKRLVACGNIYPVESIYSWKGKVEDNKEFVSLLKTQENNWEKIKKEVERIHSYECPCIMKIPAEFNEKYAQWIIEQTKL